MNNNIPAGYNEDGNKGLDYINPFDRHFDLGAMFTEDAEWLAQKSKLSMKEFLKYVNSIDLGEDYWGIFWSEIAVIRSNNFSNDINA